LCKHSHERAGDYGAAVQKALYKALEDKLCIEVRRNEYVLQRQLFVLKDLAKAGNDPVEFSVQNAVDVLRSSGYVDIGRELGIFMFGEGVKVSVVDVHR
jgi:hypothetical protein